MKLRTCEFCGTEYDASLEKCPLCGKNVDQVQPEKEIPTEKKHRGSGGARLAKKAVKEEKTSNGMWIAICSVLGAAVLAGLVFFLYIMGLFGNFSMKTENVNQEPDVLPEYNYEAQVPQTPEEEPEEEATEEEPEEESAGACTSLSISKEKETLAEAGEKFFLTAVAMPSDCTEPILYSSSDETVATVNVNGMVTAIGPGVADIIVTCGEMKEVCVVTCDFDAPEEEETEEDPEETPEENPEEQTPPTLNTEDFTLRYPGEKTQLKVNNVPEGAAISYASGNTAVVTVSDSGEVSAVGNGDTTITVTVGDVVLTCIARVNLESSAEDGGTDEFTAPFALTHTDVSLFSVGDSFTLKLLDADGKTIPVGWFASNGCVAIVGNSMQAAASGQCTVSCVYNGVTYSCIIRCNF